MRCSKSKVPCLYDSTNNRVDYFLGIVKSDDISSLRCSTPTFDYYYSASHFCPFCALLCECLS